MSILHRTLALVSLASPAVANTYIVAPSGGDFDSIQAALDVAVGGDEILVRERPGGWSERLVFPTSGSPALGFVDLRNFPGERPILDFTNHTASVTFLHAIAVVVCT